MVPLTLARFCLSGGQRWLVNIEQKEKETRAGIPHALERDGTGLKKKTSVSAQRH